MTCQHMKDAGPIKTPVMLVCEECERKGGEWVHLRTCQTCGATLCCDDSPGQHMTKHFQETGHPVMISAEPGERWRRCFVDKVLGKY